MAETALEQNQQDRKTTFQREAYAGAIECWQSALPICCVPSLLSSNPLPS